MAKVIESTFDDVTVHIVDRTLYLITFRPLTPYPESRNEKRGQDDVIAQLALTFDEGYRRVFDLTKAPEVYLAGAAWATANVEYNDEMKAFTTFNVPGLEYEGSNEMQGSPGPDPRLDAFAHRVRNDPSTLTHDECQALIDAFIPPQYDD